MGDTGWYESSLGVVYLSSAAKWAFHETLGWIYVEGSTDQDVWVWIPNLGWHWTGAPYYPYLYREEIETWIYLLRDADGNAVFYNPSTGQFE